MPVRSRNYLIYVLLAAAFRVHDRFRARAARRHLLAVASLLWTEIAEQQSLDRWPDNNDEYTGSSRTELSPEIVEDFRWSTMPLSRDGGASGVDQCHQPRSGTNYDSRRRVSFTQDGRTQCARPVRDRSGKPSGSPLPRWLCSGRTCHRGQNVLLRRRRTEHKPRAKSARVINNTVHHHKCLPRDGAFPSLTTRQITTAFLSDCGRAETEAAGKLDHQLTKNTALMLRYTFTNNKEPGECVQHNGLIDASARGSSSRATRSFGIAHHCLRLGCR